MKQIITFIAIIFFFNQSVQCQLVCRDGQLRRDDDNRLWACLAGQWGTVCNWDFDINDAVVACDNLGYGYSPSDITFGILDGAEGLIAFGSLQCDGTEDYLHDCLRTFDYLNYCDHSMDVTITCPSKLCANGDLRLVDGFAPNEGTLEICRDGSWNTICADQFGSQEAYVACRQLGFGSSTAEYTDTSFGTGHGWSQHNKFDCIGTEDRLSDCLHAYPSNSCLSYDPYTGYVSIAQLKCSGDDALDQCGSSKIRINNNGVISKDGSGRLELCDNGAWGTVNNNMFSVKDSLAACRQLGVPNPSTQVYPQGYYDNDVSGPILLKDLNCDGSENTLYATGPLKCNPSEDTADLDHSTDVFLNCWTKVPMVSCNEGDVRLVNGSSKDEGRVELCKSEEWGTFCDNLWDRREAQVICHQLGYPNSYGAFYLDSEFGTGNQIPYFFTDLNCTGSENSIEGCEKSNQIEDEKCFYGQAVGVKCYNNTGCADGETRLVGGNIYEGDVQICRNGVWGYICDEEWTESSARVVCREQGYSDKWYGRSTSSLFGGSQSAAPIVYDSISCSGNEDKLADCTNKGDYASMYPTCHYVAGVTCLKSDECQSGDIRLQEGSVSSEGRLEICSFNSWTTVKSSEITYPDAQVVCSELGYDSQWAVATEGNTWGDGDKMIYHDNVDCTGNEPAISECDKNNILTSTDASTWYWYDRAGVSCENKDLAESCSQEGAVRLKDGATAREGRLEICQNNYWGSVCNRGWTQNNGLVACRQVGYESLRPLLTSSPTRMNGSVSVYNVNCNGHEQTLTDCDWSNAIGTSSCYHGEDVALICSELPEPYSVITISSNVEEPLPLGSEVTFTCEGAPQTGDVYYSWSRDNIDLGVDTSWVTFKVGVNFTKMFHIYCNVYRANEKVAVGVNTFMVQDLLVPTESVISILPGNDITLSFSRQSTHVNDYLRELTWTLEGNLIDTNLSRYTVSNDGLSLTISSVGESDYGIYALQYNGLDVQMHNEFCEDTVLSFLRDYPILSPAYIFVTVPGYLTDIFDSDNYNRHLVQTNDMLNFTLGESFVFLTAVRSAAIPTEGLLEPDWYFNGANKVGSTEVTLRDNYPIHNLDLVNPVLFDSGYYELVVKYPFDTVLTNLGCSSHYGSQYLEFMQSKEFLGFEENYFVLDTATVEARYTEMPTAQLTSVSSFSLSENALISCMGHSGYPRYYEISLWKNGVSVMETTGPLLEFNTANITDGSKYGVYWCTVSNMILEDTTSIQIANEAKISVPLGNVNCFDFAYTVGQLEAAMKERFEDTCNCTLSSAVLKDSDYSCPEGASMVTFNTTLVFTNDDGSLVADDIVNSTLTEFNDRINRSLSIGEVSLSIMVGPPDEEEGFTLTEGGKIGLAFAGGFLAGSIVFIIVIVVLVVMILKHKRTNANKSSNDQIRFHQSQGVSGINKDDIDDDDFSPPPEDSDN